MKRILATILAVLLTFSLIGCTQEEILDAVELANELTDALTEEAIHDGQVTDSTEESISATGPAIDEDGWYYSADDVSLYLYTYNELPDNFITKNEARELGWNGGSLEDYAPGYAIGGDKFGNREGLLPEDHIYYECDIDTNGQSSRGAKRIVFSEDGLIYYTEDHYESFVLLYGGE